MMVVGITAVMAQVTTSSMSGKVTAEGTTEAIIGATVEAVHEPSGTKYAAVTNVDGRFNIQGMRTGGPYSVTVKYIGYQTKQFKDITLQLGETYNLAVWLSENSSELGEVVVLGKASKFAAEKTGASTNISTAQINSLPTVNRSISDIARLSPYANGMSFAGGDGRSTNFTLDGANLNNNFGLSSSLPGGGSPISMDAIDEIQVVVSPFDVRQTNFIGGGINAITKSGTNTFRGTAYIYHRNENMHGNRIDNAQLSEPGKVRNTTYGFTLGGPILKDKLFFFVNYEYSKVPTVINRWQASEDGVGNASNYISRTSAADLDRMREYLISHYNYNPGSYDNWSEDEDNKKFLGRLDWNITDNHHLAVRYNFTENTGWNAVNGNSSDTGMRVRINRLSAMSMAFNGSNYSMTNKVSTVSADLNSRFGDQFANQLLFTYSYIDDKRGANSSMFPFVDILNGYTVNDNGTYNQVLEPYMSFGYELFTYNNRVQNKITTVTDNFTWYAGNHKVTAGINFEHQMANNSYMRNGTGYYRYRSMDDFINGAAPETVGLTYGYNGNTHPAAEVKFNQWGLYLQDEWNVLDNLKLTGGIRFDDIVFNDDDLMRNNAIYELDFGGRHIDTGAWPKNNVQISPRVGFTWDVFGDKSLKVRGGTGLFAGRLPLVFFTNMPTNSGMLQNLYHIDTKYQNGVGTPDSRLANFAGDVITDPNQLREKMGLPESITPEQGTLPSNIAGVAHNFKMPQVWKSSIAVDYLIPVKFPWSVTAEFTYTKKINDVMLENWNIKNDVVESGQRMAGADNRYVYPAKSEYQYYTNIYDANVLKNTHKGHGYTFNVTTNLTPIENLDIMAAYTHTVMKEVSGMPGNNASSTWSSNLTVNGPNFGALQNSQYVIPDRVIASVSYTWKKHDHFTLFYQGYSPAGYSFIYSNDINNDGNSYDLMYIPRDESEIKFASEEDATAFWNFVNQDDYLKNHKGEYAEAYSARAPFVHRFDFSWKHDFTLKTGNIDHKLQLSLDIMNVGNLFNSKWGVEKTYSNSSYNNIGLLKVTNQKDVANGAQPIFSMNKVNGEYPTKTWDFNRTFGQCWSMQIGVKYFFN